MACVGGKRWMQVYGLLCRRSHAVVATNALTRAASATLGPIAKHWRFLLDFSLMSSPPHPQPALTRHPLPIACTRRTRPPALSFPLLLLRLLFLLLIPLPRSCSGRALTYPSPARTVSPCLLDEARGQDRRTPIAWPSQDGGPQAAHCRRLCSSC